jgi:hypothetical protein
MQRILSCAARVLIALAAMATASYAKGRKHEYIYAILTPSELHLWSEKQGPWVCKVERTIAGITVRAVFAQAHKRRNPVLTKAYFAAVTAVKNYRECVKRTWPRERVPLPRNVG